MKKIVLITTIILMSLLSLVCYRDDLYNNTSSKTLAMVSLLPLLLTIYIFTDPVNIYQGDLSGAGGRAGADALCQALYTSTFSFLDMPITVKAFISVDSTDNIKDLAPGYPATAAVYGVKSVGTLTPIANTWDDLWITVVVSLLNNLDTATDTNGNSWWSGSDSNGLYDDSLLSGNCSNWTTSSILQDGQVGDETQYNSTWLRRAVLNPRPCWFPRKLMCMAY